MFLHCLRRERDISVKPILSVMKTAEINEMTSVFSVTNPLFKILPNTLMQTKTARFLYVNQMKHYFVFRDLPVPGNGNNPN